MVGEVAGFFRQIGIDTAFTPIDVECCEITDMHADNLPPPVVVSACEPSCVPAEGNKIPQGCQDCAHLLVTRKTWRHTLTMWLLLTRTTFGGTI